MAAPLYDPDRIARFQQMTEADPDNELGHFSLGRAYIDAGQFKDAIPSLLRVIQINPGFSKAYGLLGLAQKMVGDAQGAIHTLTKGYTVAQERGDLMPRNEMATMLKELGAPIPEVKVEELTPEAVASGKLKCRRCGRIAPKMPERPFSGELGEQIWASVCAPCFREWIGQGTKVINELRLNLTEKYGQDVFDQHMKEFLNLE